MSLLPSRILPVTEPIGEVDGEGHVTITKNWWLLFYNLCLNSLGVPGQTGPPGTPGAAEADTADVDTADADAVALRRVIQNLDARDEPVVSSDDLPDIARALLLAQDDLLRDPAAVAQPVASVSPTGSPFTYTAPYWGTVVVNGGVVTVITIKRQGTSVTTGLTDAVVPLCRGDGVVVTYSSPPTMTFIPGSIQ